MSECTLHAPRQLPTSAEERIRPAFRLCLSRSPVPAEMSRLQLVFAELTSLARANPDTARLAQASNLNELDSAEATVALARIILNLDEFVVRE